MAKPPPSLLNDPALRDAPSIEGFKVLEPAVLYSKIGKGGMGTVYRGRHFSLECDVAIKVLKTDLALDRQFVARFEREARLAAQINHQNVVRVMDVKHRKGVHYLVMEFVKGETARERVARKGPLSESEALNILAGAATGLAEAHSKGIIHRDIKPDNILISAEGEVKLADLGLAKASQAADNSLSMLNSGVMGTPQYMPPEQWRTPDVKPSADVWALGAMLYFLLVGRSAIPSGELLVIADRIRGQDFPLLSDARSDLSPEIVALCQRCTRRDPAERFQTARELMRAVRPLVAMDDGAEVLTDTETGTGIVRTAMVTPPPRETLAKIRFKVASEVLDIEPLDATRADMPPVPGDIEDDEEPESGVNGTKIHTTPLPVSSLLQPAATPSRQRLTTGLATANQRLSQTQRIAIAGGALVLLLVVGSLAGWFGGDSKSDDVVKTASGQPDSPQSTATQATATQATGTQPSTAKQPSVASADTSSPQASSAAETPEASNSTEDLDAKAKALAAFERGQKVLPQPGMLNVAIDELEDAVRLDPSLMPARDKLVLALSANCRKLEPSDPDAAYASAKRVLELKPEDSGMAATAKRLLATLAERLRAGMSVTSPAANEVFFKPSVRVVGQMAATGFATLRMVLDDRPNAKDLPFPREDAQPVQVVAGEFVWDLAPPGNGTLLLRVQAEDTNGITAENTPIPVVINTLAPVLSISEPKDGAVVAADFLVQGKIKHPTPVTLRIGDDVVPVSADGTWQHTVHLSKDAQASPTVAVTVVARDEANRETPKQLKLTLDVLKPQLLIESKPKPITTKAAVLVTGKVTDTATCTLEANGKPIALGKDGTFDAELTMATDGQHEFRLVARDSVGNQTEEIIQLLRDTQPPVLKWNAPPREVEAGDFLLKGTVEDASPDPVVLVNGSPATINNRDWSAIVKVGDTDPVTIEVTAKDGLGHESPPLKATLIGTVNLITLDWASAAPDARGMAIGKEMYPSVVVAKVNGMRMVLIPKGEFLMGSPATELGRDDDETQHPRRINEAFYMSETEVTQQQWLAANMPNNPSTIQDDRHPVEGVSWNECRTYISKLNVQSGGFRVPTEAEWEYACRGNTTTAFGFGESLSPDDACCNKHPFDRNDATAGGTVPAGSMPANAFGLREMHGNVREWCEDLLQTYPKQGSQAAARYRSGADRVVRGGSWRSSVFDCRSASRNSCSSNMSCKGIGLRLVRDLK